ncbi:hypothetical protein [Streptomyces sp. CT34]|uniref:hypothetical protein n=1 Tax=Streptomyces sp. CT34 TaxID=1553907 RepID=UPI000A8F221A|nr:hypothetical protein [Streptomyces sp. CT34]
MRINDTDYVNHTEAARILGTALFAALRRGNLTPRQKQKIDRILAEAEARETSRKP